MFFRLSIKQLSYPKVNKTNNENIIRLSVIDDHPIVHLGIELALRKCKAQSIVLTNKFYCGAEAISSLENLNTDVFLIDLYMPDINGIDLARKILEAHPTMKIGIYSSVLVKEYIFDSFKIGALGYLSKTASPEEFVDFITTISKGERYLRGAIADILFAGNLISNQQIIITKREKEILDCVLEGCKNREIAGKLNIAERTVEFHKQNIYLKLDVNNSIDLYKAAQHLNILTERKLKNTY